MNMYGYTPTSFMISFLETQASMATGYAMFVLKTMPTLLKTTVPFLAVM